MSNILVVVPTCVRAPEFFDTATLTLNHLRTGFPTTDVLVIDNGHISTSLKVHDKAKQVGGEYLRPAKPMEHWQTIQKILGQRLPERVVFLDGDLVFFENCENWVTTTGLTGMLIPEHRSYYSCCPTAARLHTSFLVVHTPFLHQEMEKSGAVPMHFMHFEAWKPQLIYTPDAARFYDTGANLYQAVGGTPFTEQQLDSYAHIFCGSTPDYANAFLPAGQQSLLKSWHNLALNCPDALRGNWRALKWN